MTTQILGITLRCLDEQATMEFYFALGLTKNRVSGDGSLCLLVETHAKEMPFEIDGFDVYPPMDSYTFVVDSMDEALTAIERLGILPKTEVRTRSDGKAIYCYITDPDGRTIMLVQGKSP